MSDNYLYLIPCDPTFFPSGEVAERARIHMSHLAPDADEVTTRTSDLLEFIHAGANFERVTCPQCTNELDVGWTTVAIESAIEANTVHNVRVPCCGATVSLNDLVYDSPEGFARFVIEVMNPTFDDLPNQEIHRLSGIVGSPLRVIWAHY